MTKIILFEGIPTVGKSRLIDILKERIERRGLSSEVADDREIGGVLFARNNLSDRDPVDDAQGYLATILEEKVSAHPDFLLLHNFHVFFARLNNSRGKDECLEDYRMVEERLKAIGCLLVFLRLRNDCIASHFNATIAYRKEIGRDSSIQKFWESKGGTDEIRALVYAATQDLYAELFDESILEKAKFEIVDEPGEYDRIADEIVSRIF